MPCFRNSPERNSTSKAPKRVLRVRTVASIARFRAWRQFTTEESAEGISAGPRTRLLQLPLIQRAARSETKQMQTIFLPLRRKRLRVSLGGFWRSTTLVEEICTRHVRTEDFSPGV